MPEAVQRRRELLSRRRRAARRRSRRQAAGADSARRAVRARRQARRRPDRRGPSRDRQDQRGTGRASSSSSRPRWSRCPGVAQRLERELKQLERVQSAGVAQGARVAASAATRPGSRSSCSTARRRSPRRSPRAGRSRSSRRRDLIEVIGEALIEAAQVGVVHRDLAPKNVLFAGAGRQAHQLLAAGADDRQGARRARVRRARAGRRQARSISARTSTRSARCTTTCSPARPCSPARADEVHQAARQSGDDPAAVAARARCPAPVEAVIMRALDRSPTKRFLTVRQFVDEVGRVGRGEVVELKQRSAAPAPTPKAELVQTLMGVRGGRWCSRPPSASQAAADRVGADGRRRRAVGRRRPQRPRAGAHADRRRAVRDRQRRRCSRADAAAQGVADGAPMPQPMPQPRRARSPRPAVADRRSPSPPRRSSPRRSSLRRCVAAPVVAHRRRSRSRRQEEGGRATGQKGKFRETMWFKKGDLDAQAAVAAAEERARTGKDVADRQGRLAADGRALQGRRLDHARRQREVQPAHRRDADDGGAASRRGAGASIARSPRTR